MAMAKWNDSFRTGHELVDHQHEELFRMVNNLHDAIVAGKGKDVLASTLQELAKYTLEHFRDEEALMTSIGYPLLAVHKEKHDDLTRQVKELLAKFAEGKLVLSMTLSTFLSNWLQHHIKGDDVALVAYLKEHPPVKQTAAAHR